MATTGLPPPPSNDPPGSYAWVEWYRQLRLYISTASSIPWSVIQFAGSNITDLATYLHNSMQSIQGGQSAEYYHLTSAQHTDLTDAGDSTSHYHATDRARANHTGTQVMTTISDLPTLASGTYTPSLTSVTNVAASTAYVCQYMRVGSVVTVSGKIDIDATSAGALELGVSLPIASNFSAAEQAGGVAQCASGTEVGMAILADATNDRVRFMADKTDTSNHAHHFTFTYQII